ncbi:MAG: 4Fe-4S binding protein [Candidatus Hermodarchaeota archaeon]|nr:4Fe-4S binding protein [Candidatus Hermodarchaeota archaeon]
MTPLKREPPNKRFTCITYPEAGAMGLTGDWRIFRPVVDKEKCTGCQICWMYCPDAAITMDEDNIPVFNLEYCKGCMICETNCPVKAISRVRETEAEAAVEK